VFDILRYLTNTRLRNCYGLNNVIYSAVSFETIDFYLHEMNIKASKRRINVFGKYVYCKLVYSFVLVFLSQFFRMSFGYGSVNSGSIKSGNLLTS
jgi:hypothetical protein